MRSKVLLADAIFDMTLGLLLVAFAPKIFQVLGLPAEVPPFYSSILGGLLMGIGLALLIEQRRGESGPVGLGLGGVLTINLFGMLALAVLLICGRVYISPRGHIVLWGLVLLLTVISIAEWWLFQREQRGSQ